jgi:hypothetical protein
MKEAVPVVSGILCLLLIPGSFVGAFFLIRNFAAGTGARVLLTAVLGMIFLVAGVVAVVAGCASISPPDFK